jgi:hypothetical protein
MDPEKPEEGERSRAPLADSLEAMVQELWATLPEGAWDEVPLDWGVNHDHYLYGAPKVWTPEGGDRR